MISFITCEPASNVPVQPKAAIFHVSGPRFTRNSETIAWLPGGKNRVKSVIRSSRLVLPPIRLVASATATSNAGKPGYRFGVPGEARPGHVEDRGLGLDWDIACRL